MPLFRPPRIIAGIVAHRDGVARTAGGLATGRGRQTIVLTSRHARVQPRGVWLVVVRAGRRCRSLDSQGCGRWLFLGVVGLARRRGGGGGRDCEGRRW